MANSLYSYAMIRALYDQGKDYIDCFLPFAILSAPEDRDFQLSELHDRAQEEHGLQIPSHSLTVILTRAKRRSLVVQRYRHTYRLTDEGRSFRANLEPQRDVQRRVNALLTEVSRLLERELGVSYSQTECEEKLRSFIQANIELFQYFIDTRQADVPRPRLKLSRQEELVLARYFQHVESQEPGVFETLRDVVCGTILSAIVYTDRLADMGARFKRTTAYLDSNLLLSLLGLHHEEVSRAAEELVSLIRETTPIRLRVFDFTIAEMISVLRGYASRGGGYSPNIRVFSIYSSLRARGWTPAGVRRLIAELEPRLADLGIEVQPTSVDLADPGLVPEERRDSLRKYKGHPQSLRSQNHDLAAIAQVRRRRAGPARRIERADVLFLTSDFKLARFNLVRDLHHQNETVPEVIPDRLFANILWLKNPSKLKDISLNSVISVHSRGIVVDRAVWSRFFETLQELEATGEVSADDASLLLYDRQLEEFLTRTTPREVDSDLVKERVEAARKRIAKDQASELWQQAEEFRKDAERAMGEEETKWQERIDHAKKKAKRGANRSVARFRWAVAGISLLAVVGVTLLIGPTVLAHWDRIEPVAWLVSLGVGGAVWVLGLLGYRHDLGRVRTRVEDWLSRRLYRRRLRMAGVDHLLGVEDRE